MRRCTGAISPRAVRSIQGARPGTEAAGPIRERLRARIAEKQRVNDTGNPEHVLEIGGQRRTYLLHRPAGDDGRKGRRRGIVDDPTTEISATDLMWEFFARHPKK